MPGNRNVFVSHTHEDNERCVLLLAALDAWGVDYWYDTEQLDAGAELSQRIQQALSERDVFLRVCTDAAQRSFWMSRELAAAQGLRADAQQRGHGGHRKTVSLILTPSYTPDAQEKPDVVVNATAGPPVEWLKQLRVALGVPSAERRISRRMLFGAGGGAAAAVVAASAAGTLLLTTSAPPKVAPVLPTTRLPAQTPAPDARQQWFFKMASGGAVSNVAVVGTTVYAASAQSGEGIYGLNAADGTILWRQPQITSGTSDAPLIVNNILYTCLMGGTNGSGLAALNIADGSIVWTTRTPNDNTADIKSSPVIAGSSIYATAAGFLYAFNLSDGTPLWKAPLTGTNSLLASTAPVVAGTTVYCGAPDNQLHAFDALSGSPLWSVPIPGGVNSNPVVVGDRIIFGTGYTNGANTGGIMAVSASNGATAWQVTAGDGSLGVQSAPTVVNGTVYIGSNMSIVYAIDAASGNVLWQRVPQTNPSKPSDYLGGEVATKPFVANNVVYVTANVVEFGGAVFALSVTDGTQLWVYQATSADSGDPTSPVVAGNALYFGASDRAVYAISLS